MDTSAFSPSAELPKLLKNRNTRPDLSRFLIDFGLNLASASPRGGIISTERQIASDKK